MRDEDKYEMHMGGIKSCPAKVQRWTSWGHQYTCTRFLLKGQKYCWQHQPKDTDAKH